MKMKFFFKQITIYVSAIFLTLAISGCASKQKTKDLDFFSKWKAKAQTSTPRSPSYEMLKTTKKALLKNKGGKILNNYKLKAEVKPNYKLGANDNAALSELDSLSSKKVTIKMDNTDIVVVLRSLAKIAGKNIIISENVKGKTNINVIDAPWNEAFASLLRTHGLTFNMIGNTIRIKTLEDMKQDFRIENEYLAQKEKRLAMEQNELLTKVIFLRYIDVKEVVSLLKPFISGQSGLKLKFKKSVSPNIRNNAVVIHASENEINQCMNLIKKIDKPSKQVFIEAQIVETTKNTARDLGIKWGGIGEVNDHNMFQGGSNGLVGNTLYDSNGNPLSVNSSGNWAANFPVPNPTNAFSLGYLYKDMGKNLIAAELTALESEGKLNILSSPSITTIDNKPAIIESGRDVPYQTVENDEVNIEWKKAVLRLDVTPHIIDKKTLRVKIKTNKDELDWTNAALSKGNPVVVTKKAETDMILFDGQTTVIGGLTKETENQKNYGIPFLKDIPLIGFLFGGSSQTHNMDNILIFITPHILKPYQGRTISENKKYEKSSVSTGK